MANKQGEIPQPVRWSDKEGTNFFVITNNGMAEKWKKDKTIPLVQVVQRFAVFKGEHGTEDVKPSNMELENSFGTSKVDDIIPKMIEEGKILGPLTGLSKS